MLQLSPFVLPQVRMGALRMTSLNMTASPERLSYVRGLQAHLASLTGMVVGGLFPRKDLEYFYEHAFGAKLFTQLAWDDAGTPHLTAWEHAEDYVSFDLDRLGIMFLDGRLRDEREMVYIPTGAATPAFGSLVSRMAHGIDRAELVASATDEGIELDDAFVGLLVERGVLDEVAAPMPMQPRFAPASGDRITWLGHSGMIYQVGTSTVWFDPLVPARLRYTAEDMPIAFADDLASPIYMPEPYGPSCEQLTIGELPRPDAVVISHQDIDHFDLGGLMCLPEATPIVVPATRPGRPWDIDVGDTIARVLGERRIVRLAHGETLTFGDIHVTATPFVGEFPTALANDWNAFVVRGREAAVALCNASSVLPEHAARIAELLGDRGPRAILFATDLYAGPVKNYMGFREGPNMLFAAHRPWPWYLPMHRWFDPTPAVGVASEILRTIGSACGLRRAFVYEIGGAPWLTFEAPHVHRYNIWNMVRRVHERVVKTAHAIEFEVPALKIGVPFPL